MNQPEQSNQSITQEQWNAGVRPAQHYTVPAGNYHAGDEVPLTSAPALPIALPRRRRRWPHVIGYLATAGLFLGIGLAGNGNNTNSNLSAATPQVTVTQQVPGPAVTVTAGAPAVVKPTAAPKPAIPTTIGDGTWQVGVDMQTGTYVGTVPADSSGCYWERAKDASGSLNSILANDNLNPGAHVAIAVGKTTKYVTLDGCGTLHRR